MFALKVVERAHQQLLGFPLRQVLICELVSHIQPQGGVGGHVVPPKVHPVGQPRVDVVDEGIHQVTSWSEAPSIQLSGHVVL